jgi:Carboxypeptidase regulatory-like domain
MKSGHKFLLGLGWVTACFSFSIAAHAQYNGNIQGVILDPAGADVANATVTLTDQETGVSQQTKSGDSGNYRFSSLEPGPYVVKVSAAGFDVAEVKTNLETSQTLAINVDLKVRVANESVTVTTSGPILDVDENRMETTIPSQEVVNLPELNRNTWDTLTVAPGISGTGTRAAGESPGGGADNFGTQTPAISANGRSYTGNQVMVDGMNVTSPVQNGNIVLSPIQDSVAEVAIQANSWDAENSLGSSILVQVTTKSGTNKYHGTGNLYWFNQDMNANQEFSGPTTPYSRKDLSATFGGPVIKDKTFFFADFEKLWATVAEALSGTQTWEDPAFVSWATTNYPNTLGTQVLTGWPVKFGKSGGVYETAAQYFGTGSSGCGTAATDNIPCSTAVLDSGTFNTSPYYNALQYNFRLDEYFTKSDRFYLAYYNDSFTQEQPAIRTGLTVLNFQANRYGQADYTHTFSPRVLAEGAFAFASVGGANGQDGDLKVPNITVNGQTEGITSGGWGPGEYRGPEYNWRGVLSAEIGKHTLKFGANGARAIEHGDFTPVNVRPSFTFTNLLNLVTDQPFSESIGALNPSTGLAAKVAFGGDENPFGFFVQDDWKVKPNLALTLALRWDDYSNHTPWGNSGFKYSNILLGSGSTLQAQIADATVTPVSAVFASSISDLWSPRVGFSWDPTRRGTWTVRGGVGVYHDMIAMGQSIDEMRNNPPAVASATFSVQNPNEPAPLFALAPSGTYPFNYPLPTFTQAQLAGLVGISSAVGMDRNLSAPLAVNYVAGVEHELPGNYVVGASYAGSIGRNQLTGADENRVNGDLLQDHDTVLSLVRPNQNYGALTYVNNANSTTYNAMILTFRGNPAPSAHFQGSYMLSHVQDYPETSTRFDQDDALGLPDPAAYTSYHGDANWDIRHRFSLSGTYTIPGMHEGIGKVITGGWEFGSIAILETGTPYWVFNGNPFQPVCSNEPNNDCYNSSNTWISGAVVSGDSGGDYGANGGGGYEGACCWSVPNVPSNNGQYTGSHSRSAYENGVFGNPATGAAQAAFPVPALATDGNEPRNVYRNPGMIQWDASLIKNNPIEWFGPGGNLQLRFDFLNLPNHVNLSTVNSNIGGSNFGQVTSALQSRQVQLGVRVAF